jgi:hypothetical protein
MLRCKHEDTLAIHFVWRKTMRRKMFAGAVLAAFCSFLLSQPVLAHHGAAGYDMEKAVTLKATITDFEWTNPHSQIYFDVTDDKGKVAHWVAETEPPAVMMERGWAKRSLKPGDQVTVYCFELAVRKRDEIHKEDFPRCVLASCYPLSP